MTYLFSGAIMEDATIAQAQPAQEPLYQQGKYPSIVDTDDLVFEMGKQLVDRLNKDKLLDMILKKSKILETALHEAVDSKSLAEKESIALKLSNEQYVGNNQRLDAELVKVRNEMEGYKNALQKSETSLNALHETITSLEDELKAKDAEILKHEKKKTPRKRK
jgi:hypothetical protein